MLHDEVSDVTARYRIVACRFVTMAILVLVVVSVASLSAATYENFKENSSVDKIKPNWVFAIPYFKFSKDEAKLGEVVEWSAFLIGYGYFFHVRLLLEKPISGLHGVTRVVIIPGTIGPCELKFKGTIVKDGKVYWLYETEGLLGRVCIVSCITRRGFPCLFKVFITGYYGVFMLPGVYEGKIEGGISGIPFYATDTITYKP